MDGDFRALFLCHIAGFAVYNFDNFSITISEPKHLELHLAAKERKLLPWLVVVAVPSWLSVLMASQWFPVYDRRSVNHTETVCIVNTRALWVHNWQFSLIQVWSFRNRILPKRVPHSESAFPIVVGSCFHFLCSLLISRKRFCAQTSSKIIL